MGNRKSDRKISKTDIGLEINRAFINDDMDALFQVVSTYMYFAELNVSSEIIMKLSEDGLISPVDPKRIDQWPYRDDDGKS